MGMTSAGGAQRVEQAEVEERRPPVVVIVLGVLTALLFFAAGGFGGGLSALPAPHSGVGGGELPFAVWVGWNGTQRFDLVVPRGSFVYRDVLICNVGGWPAYVEARVVEAPREVRVFAFWLDGEWFGVRWGNSTALRRVFGVGECTRARAEIVVDALAGNGTYVVVVDFTSRRLG
ncbi:MAG: hypothetical protein ABWK05_01210 [Pyrobaculum sp.]